MQRWRKLAPASVVWNSSRLTEFRETPNHPRMEGSKSRSSASPGERHGYLQRSRVRKNVAGRGCLAGIDFNRAVGAHKVGKHVSICQVCGNFNRVSHAWFAGERVCGVRIMFSTPSSNIV